MIMIDNDIEIVSISAYKYGPYPDDERENCAVMLNTNIDEEIILDLESPEADDILGDFEIRVNGVKKIPDCEYFVLYQFEGTDIRFQFKVGLFVVGTQYSIQVIYTANENRQIKVITVEGEELVLKSFDTGIKTITAELW